MTPKHENSNKTKAKGGEESHHPIEPPDANISNPLRRIEVDTKAQIQTHRVHGDNSLGSMRTEAFADIIDGDRDRDETANRHKDLTDGKYDPMEMVLECSTHKSKTNWLKDQRGRDKCIKAIFRFPIAFVSGREPERNAIRE